MKSVTQLFVLVAMLASASAASSIISAGTGRSAYTTTGASLTRSPQTHDGECLLFAKNAFLPVTCLPSR